jgi:hypothetical protein
VIFFDMILTKAFRLANNMPKSILAAKANDCSIALTKAISRAETEEKEFHELIFVDIGTDSDMNGITGRTTDMTLG